jgi:Ca-activated chloride channel homolog
MRKIIFLLYALSFVFHLNAQDNTTPSPIIFICDASGSMMGQIQGKTKMEIATSVLSASVNNLPENQKVGLVAYGHRKKDDCKDVEFLVDVESGTKTQVNQSLKSIKALGRTPLALSATQVIDKLRNAKMKATIILVTDGIESCNGNICNVITAAKKEGIDFRLHIIGFGLKAGETEQLRCAAKAGGGQYYDAANAGGLSEVLNEATAADVDKPLKNFSVYAIKNGKPIDALVKAYKAGTKTDVTSVRTYSDTGFLYLTAGTYDLEVTPLENSDVEAVVVPGVKSFDNKIAHQTVSFDASKIQVTTSNNGGGWNAVVKVLSKDGKTISSGRTYGKPKVYEINPGVYDVEITAMVIEGMETTHRMENVTISAGETKALEHNFKSGIAMVGAKSAKGLVDAGVNIKNNKTKQSMANGRTYTSASSNPKKFILTPGTYEVTITAFKEFNGKKQTFTMVVKEGATTEQVINF